MCAPPVCRLLGGQPRCAQASSHAHTCLPPRNPRSRRARPPLHRRWLQGCSSAPSSCASAQLRVSQRSTRSLRGVLVVVAKGRAATTQNLNMDAAALVAALREPGVSVDDLTELCLQMSDMASDDSCVGDVALSAVATMVTAMRAHPHRADLQMHACHALGLLTQHSAANKIQAQTAGAAAAIVGALRAHVADESVQHAGFSALVHCVHSAASARDASDAGFTQAVVAASRRHANFEHLQDAVCRSLSVFAKHAASSDRVEASRCGALTAVLAVMRTHTNHAMLQLHGCEALGDFYADTAISLADAFAADAMKAIVCAMNSHRSVSAVQRFDLRAMCSLIRVGATPNGGANAYCAGAVDAVISALRAHPANADVQIDGCDMLNFVCCSDRRSARRACFGNAAGGDSLPALHADAGPLAALLAMRTHLHDAGVQRSAGGLLITMLAIESRVAVQRAFALGADDAYVSAMRSHPRDMRVQSNACLGLVLLTRDRGDAHMPISDDAIEAVVAATHVEFADDSIIAGTDASSVCAARAYALNALHCMLTGSAAAEVCAVCAGALEAVMSDAVKACRRDHAFVAACRRARNNGDDVLSLLTPALQAAVQRHDAAPCTFDGCKRCGLRASGAMCALPGCGLRKRADGSGKTLLRCGRCMAAAYCGAAHQREHWRRHKPLCAPQQAAPQQEPADDAD